MNFSVPSRDSARLLVERRRCSRPARPSSRPDGCSPRSRRDRASPRSARRRGSAAAGSPRAAPASAERRGTSLDRGDQRRGSPRRGRPAAGTRAAARRAARRRARCCTTSRGAGAAFGSRRALRLGTRDVRVVEVAARLERVARELRLDRPRAAAPGQRVERQAEPIGESPGTRNRCSRRSGQAARSPAPGRRSADGRRSGGGAQRQHVAGRLLQAALEQCAPAARARRIVERGLVSGSTLTGSACFVAAAAASGSS